MVDQEKRKRYAASYRALIPLVKCEATKLRLEAAAKEWEAIDQPIRAKERVEDFISGDGQGRA